VRPKWPEGAISQVVATATEPLLTPNLSAASSTGAKTDRLGVRARLQLH
jgi:hypothetical protein